jgi:hypothetical protein
MDDAPLTFRDGRYRAVRVLGEGAQATTYDAVDVQVGQAVAVKRFRVRGARSWKEVELAEREARVLAEISHPLLPRYVDHFEEGGELFLVTSKIEGHSLASLRARGVTMGEEEVLRFLRDAAEVLGYLHGRAPPIVHRDIKPGNVIWRLDGSFAFIDFGAVRDRMKPEGGSTVVGTFGYMAPEQFQGRALPASDAYGVAATVLSLLAGKEPEQLPHKGLAIDVRAAIRGRASERLTRILEQLLEPDPDRRASQIGPLLTQRSWEGEGREQDWGRWDRQPWDGRPWDGRWQYDKRAVRDQVRRAHEEARRVREEARRLRQAAREQARAWRGRGRRVRGIPWPVELILTMVFSVGLVAVAVATQVVVPVLLRVLSVLFARRALSEAADAVQEAGGAAVRAIVQSRRWMRGDPPAPPGAKEGPRVDASTPPPAPPARVEQSPRLRVDDAGPEDEFEEHEGAPRGRTGR